MQSFRSHLGLFRWNKVLSQRPHGEFDGVPQFVAEVTVAQDTVDIQVDVPACEGESAKPRTESLLKHPSVKEIINASATLNLNRLF